ncbi:uncharacterized protein LOC119395033 [Rhipicephalus sanguineus]|uniref:uncharacterized protein LOC119395033 n=1 Tax=Rhipicephalus sanguineus TaxID=34632 RepID=UPI00189550D8|nr:uncharacterized protein LOC119395033 [Rhipicephalus sanguineus]
MPGSIASDAAVAAAVHDHLRSHAANTECFWDTVSLVDMAMDASAEHVVAEFALDSSIDEALGLPTELIYTRSHEHAEAAPAALEELVNAVEGPLIQESVWQAAVHPQAAPTRPLTEGLFNVVDGQASAKVKMSSANHRNAEIQAKKD